MELLKRAFPSLLSSLHPFLTHSQRVVRQSRRTSRAPRLELLEQRTLLCGDPPTAVAGGPYSVDEGGSVILDGSGSSDPFGDPLTYEWDFDYDGVTFDVDATGVGPTFSAAGHDGPLTFTIALRVIDDCAEVSPIDTTTLDVNNVAPTADAGGPYTVDEGSAVGLTAAASTDPGNDIFLYEWDFDYDGVTFNAEDTGMNVSFDASRLDGPLSRTVAVQVTDSNGDSDIATSTVTVNNVAPTADAGGPYTVDEGSTVGLTAAASSDPGDDISTYEWDFDYDGVTFDVDETGMTPTFDASSLDGPLSRTVAVRVTDTDGAFDIATSTVTVDNVAPTVDPVTGSADGVAGQPQSYSTSFTDPAAADTHEISWDFGDGTVIAFHPTTDAGALTPTHIFVAPGSYTVRATIRDDDGDSDFEELNVTITSTGMQNDPMNPGQTMLVVGGTTGNDIIFVRPVGKTGSVTVTINDVLQGTFTPTSRISIYGQAGNDRLEISRGVRLNALIDGGAGNDLIRGGDGNNALLGGTGNDKVFARRGRDLLISGTGDDLIQGMHGEDILIAGTTTHDADDVALMSILAEWNSARDQATRMANIIGPGTDPRLNGPYFLDGTTVTLDVLATSKKVKGNKSPDWTL